MDAVHIPLADPMKNRPEPAPRPTYRHGDLRRALVDAGLELAREHGPGAVALREVTRRAGVVPNAAYRHFGNLAELLQAVRASALAEAARSMERELAAVEAQFSGLRMTQPRLLARARARVRAVGAGYLRFAWKEPGLFRTAFSPPVGAAAGADPAAAGTSGRNPFELLGAALDELVAAGALPRQRRPQAEYVAWSAVHGLAMLVLEGPLKPAARPQIDQLGASVLDMVERGL
jgi:AcrR family transcriptional regulator